MKPLKSKRLEDEIILSFSQITAIKLATQRMLDVFKRADAARVEQQDIVDAVAIEAGIPREEISSWQLTQDGTKFTKVKPLKPESAKENLCQK